MTAKEDGVGSHREGADFNEYDKGAEGELSCQRRKKSRDRSDQTWLNEGRETSKGGQLLQEGVSASGKNTVGIKGLKPERVKSGGKWSRETGGLGGDLEKKS